MKNSVFVSSLLLLSSILFMSGCKKDKTVEAYFTSSSATGVIGEKSVVVYIEFSEPTSSVVELDFKSVGRNFASFGSYNQRFSLDDSEKCQVTIDNEAFVDSSGHILVGFGVKKLAVTFTAQYDNFPHAPAEYTVQISGAKNAKVRQGSDVFTYSIASKNEDNVIISTIRYTGLEHDSWEYADGSVVDTLLPKTGVFTSSTSSFTKISSSPDQYSLVVNYTMTGDNSSKATNLSISYPYWNKPQLGNHVSDCTNNPVIISWNPPAALGVPATTNTTFTCSDLTNSITSINFGKNNSLYGEYNSFSGHVDLEKGSDFYFVGDLTSPFILFR